MYTVTNIDDVKKTFTTDKAFIKYVNALADENGDSVLGIVSVSDAVVYINTYCPDLTLILPKLSRIVNEILYRPQTKKVSTPKGDYFYPIVISDWPQTNEVVYINEPQTSRRRAKTKAGFYIKNLID